MTTNLLQNNSTMAMVLASTDMSTVPMIIIPTPQNAFNWSMYESICNEIADKRQAKIEESEVLDSYGTSEQKKKNRGQSAEERRAIWLMEYKERKQSNQYSKPNPMGEFAVQTSQDCDCESQFEN